MVKIKNDATICIAYHGDWRDKRKSAEKDYTIGRFKYNKDTFTCELQQAVVDADTFVKMIKSGRCVFINATCRPDRTDDSKSTIVIRRVERDINTIKRIATMVRGIFEHRYGSGTDLAGHCIEASETLLAIYNALGFRGVKTVEGWCEFDDEYYGSDRPYDPHTWLEFDNGLYVDITADQFNPGMYEDTKYNKIIVRHGLPHGMSYSEPVIYED